MNLAIAPPAGRDAFRRAGWPLPVMGGGAGADDASAVAAAAAAGGGAAPDPDPVGQSAGSRASRTRRQRGYAWEDSLAKRISAVPGWTAFRLGSPSIGLPDVLAVRSRGRSMMVIEAKSGTGSSLSVPADQVERCVKWTRILDAYGDRRAVLAFKFLSKRRVGTDSYKGRQLREFYKVWNTRRRPAECVCTYDGRTYLRGASRRRRDVDLDDCAMPFGAPAVRT